MNAVGSENLFYPSPGGLTPLEFDSYLDGVKSCNSSRLKSYDNYEQVVSSLSTEISEKALKSQLDNWSLGRLYTIALFYAPLRLRDGDEKKIFDLGKTKTVTVRLTTAKNEISVKKQSAFLLGKKRRQFLSGKPIGFVGVFEGVQIEILNMENSL